MFGSYLGTPLSICRGKTRPSLSRKQWVQEADSHGWVGWIEEEAKCSRCSGRGRTLAQVHSSSLPAQCPHQRCIHFQEEPIVWKWGLGVFVLRTDSCIPATSCNSQSSSPLAPRQLFINLSKCCFQQKLACRWCWTQQKSGEKRGTGISSRYRW